MISIKYKCKNCEMNFSKNEMIMRKVNKNQDIVFCPYCDSDDIEKIFDYKEEDEDDF